MTVRALGIVCATLALTGCANHAVLSSVWHDEAYQRQSFSRVVVVGVSDNIFRRTVFEEAVAAELTSGTTEAWPSAHLMNPETPLNEDTLSTVVKDKQADALLITRLADTQVKANEVDSRVDVEATSIGGNVVDFFRYDYEDVEQPGYLQAKVTVVLSTNLYETASGKLVYSIESVTTDKDTEYSSVVYEVIENTSVEIARRLRRDGLTH